NSELPASGFLRDTEFEALLVHSPQRLRQTAEVGLEHRDDDRFVWLLSADGHVFQQDGRIVQAEQALLLVPAQGIDEAVARDGVQIRAKIPKTVVGLARIERESTNEYLLQQIGDRARL